jgi:hypothetical protein
MPAETQKPIDTKFFLLFIPVAFLTYLVHEFGHWSVGEMLGNRMVYSLNLVWPRDGRYLEQSHALYVSLGGPGFSVLQAALALLIIEKFRTLFGYPFAFFPMYNRFFADLFGGFSKQDEARIALLLGTGTYLVAFMVLALLLLIVIRCSYRLRLGGRDIGYILVVTTACQLLVIGTYEFLKM